MRERAQAVTHQLQDRRRYRVSDRRHEAAKFDTGVVRSLRSGLGLQWPPRCIKSGEVKLWG